MSDARIGETEVNRTLLEALRWGGRALAVLSLLFVFLRLRTYSEDIELTRLAWGEWVAAGGLALVYGVASIMLALAWWYLLGHFGSATSSRWAVRVYGLSQISKYVPGNIFHLAARQGRGMAGGVPARPLAESAVWELGLLATCGALFGFLTLPLLVGSIPVLAGALLFAAAITVALLFLSRVVGTPVARAFGWQAAFLAFSGLLFLGVLAVLDAEGVEYAGLWLPVLGAYIVAWLAGLVTPGAPAGLGVRELVLLLLLGGTLAEATLLEAVVLARVVSVLGDVILFVAALAIRETS